jgi:two-component sensor histidine kinase
MEAQNWRERLPNSQPFMKIDDGRVLAQAIVDTVRESLLVLDADLRVVAASRSFYSTFQVDRQNVQGRLLYDLGDGQWNIPELRELLEKIIPEKSVMEAFEVQHEFVGIGWRTMLLNARKVFYEGSSNSTILLAIEDVTERHNAELRLQDLLKEKEMLLLEMQHRVGNSLQIIASILLMKARVVQSEETRLQLHDAHQRVLSIAAVQKHLQATGRGDLIEVDTYLSKLCETLASSLIGGSRAVTLTVNAQGGKAESSQVVSIGLIVTELVMNSLKHALLAEAKDARIVVAYEVAEENWKLSVADNGTGNPDLNVGAVKQGLGTSIVQALSKQLDAQLEVASGAQGTTVTVTHAVFSSQVPQAA